MASLYKAYALYGDRQLMPGNAGVNARGIAACISTRTTPLHAFNTFARTKSKRRSVGSEVRRNDAGSPFRRLGSYQSIYEYGIHKESRESLCRTQASTGQPVIRGRAIEPSKSIEDWLEWLRIVRTSKGSHG